MIENVCDEQTGQLYWHMSITQGYTCTNSQVYPAEWDYPINRQNFLHDTVEECCKRFVDQGLECNVVDVNEEGEEWPCNKWHLSVELDSYGRPVDDKNTCTNTGMVHQAWLDYQQYYIQDSYESCCERWNIPMEECKMNDACAEETTTTTTSTTTTTTTTTTPKTTTATTTTTTPTTITTTTTDQMVPTQECEKSSKEGHWHIDKYGDSSW